MTTSICRYFNSSTSTSNLFSLKITITENDIWKKGYFSFSGCNFLAFTQPYWGFDNNVTLFVEFSDEAKDVVVYSHFP